MKQDDGEADITSSLHIHFVHFMQRADKKRSLPDSTLDIYGHDLP
jgi:hypothetical protein